MSVYLIKIENPTKKDFEVLQELMNTEKDAWNNAVRQFARDNNISEACSSDVLYLRTRSRHTEELERKLIQLHKEGNPPNICEF